jgi:hypothetical protein
LLQTLLVRVQHRLRCPLHDHHCLFILHPPHAEYRHQGGAFGRSHH